MVSPELFNESIAAVRGLLRSRSQGLAVAEFDEVTVRIFQPAVVAHRVGLLARRPGEAAGVVGFVGNGIDGAWVDESTKNDWRGDWLARFDELAKDLEVPPGT